MRLLLAIFGVSVLVGFAGPARGDPDVGGTADPAAAFLASLRAAGITYSSLEQTIATAQGVCRLIRSGKPGPQILADLQARNPGLTTEHAAQFSAIAARSYCPDQLVPAGPGIGDG